MGNREVEYSELRTFLRYLLEYRLKIFNFSVAFNGALMTLAHVYVETGDYFALILLCVLGLITSAVFLLVERRIVFVYEQHIGYTIQVERLLGFGVVSKNVPKIKQGELRFAAVSCSCTLA